MIYVDDPMDITGAYQFWCHCWTDGSPDDLHEFARAIGLKKHWFQGKNLRFQHYDLSPAKRRIALDMGAVYMPLRDYLRDRATAITKDDV